TGKNTETAKTISAVVPAHGTALYRVHPVSNYAQLAPSTVVQVSSSTGYSGADAAVSPGESTTLTSTVTNYGRAAIKAVRVTGDAPDGWTLDTTGAWHHKRLATGKSFATPWQLSVPASASPGNYKVTFTVSYAYAGGKTVVVKQPVVVQVVTPPPSGSVALSDVTWVSASNGWGPVEKDMSNGETAAGDGKTISIRGTTYAKGLGTNAASDIVYYLGGACSSLKTDVGIDDEEATNGGDVIFQIYADDAKVADSGTVTNTSPEKPLTADLAGATWLRLHVDPDGATTYDHGDWAGPVLTCAAG
ncbi:MAG: alpha-galactosidase, partial [Pseudonocardiales bacterium]|nr:alpha-galactosidase [Pseudonocardiales bacterium]